MGLFRQEALEHHAGRLHGDIRLGMPLSWQVIGYAMFAAVLAAFIFLAVASYTHVEVVRGSVVLDRGTASIVPSRAGVIKRVRVADGEAVEPGAPLAEIQAEEALATGMSAPRKVLAALKEQEASLVTQTNETLSAGAAEEERLAAEISGLAQELSSLQRQIQVQRDLVASAVRELEAIQDVARKGYISRRDVILREETILARRQQLDQLEQTRAAKTADLAEARRSIARVRAQSGAQAASLLSSRAELGQRRAEAEAGEGYILTAPMRGRVTALTARRGQAVQPGETLMIIVPSNAARRVELYVPTRAAGFLRIGQDVRLAIDAFPYERFGTIAAKISHISATTLAREGNAENAGPVYLVTADIARPWVRASGERQPLAPGMTLTARIVTERQSLLQWLFEPVLAVRNR